MGDLAAAIMVACVGVGVWTVVDVMTHRLGFARLC